MNNPFFADKTASATACALRQLQVEGVIAIPASHALLLLIGVRPDTQGWLRFVRVFLALVGTLSLSCGVIFFFAWNWQALPRLMKFALIEGAIIALMVLVWWRWTRMAAHLALIAIGLLLGVLFAVYGQIYQTGAESWLLFCSWSFSLFLLAVFARLTALWFLCWLTANVAFLLRLDSIGFGYGVIGLDLLYQASQLIVLAAWFIGVRRADWLFRIMAFWLLATLTLASSYWIYDGTPWGILSLVLWLGTLALGYLLFYRRQRDLFILTNGLFSIGFFLVAAASRLFLQVGVMVMLSAGLVVFFLCAYQASRWLKRWRHDDMPQENIAQQAMLQKVMQQLQLYGVMPEQCMQRITALLHRRMPWYVHVAFILSGWFAGCLIFSWLILGLLLSVGFDSLDNLNFLLLAVVSGVPGWFFLRKSAVILQQIGLSWAIASTLSLCSAVVLAMGGAGWGSGILDLLLLLALALLNSVFRNRVYHCLSSAVMVFLLINGLASLSVLNTVFPALVVACITSLLMLLATDDRYAWRYRAWLIGMMAGLLLLCFCHTMPYSWLTQAGGLHLVPVSGFNEGVAAGLLFPALIIGRRAELSRSWPVLYGAALLAVISLFAPGIALASSGILLARYHGSKVLLLVAATLLVLYTIDNYYFAGISLLAKSLVLAGSGGAGLLLALWAHRCLHRGAYA